MRVLTVTVGLAIFLPSLARATPCVVGSLQSYIDLGSGGCEIEDKTVSDFFDIGPLGSATPILPDAVMVTPLSTPGNPGLTFDFGVSVSAGDFVESLFSFLVTVFPGGMPIESVSFSMSGSVIVPDGVNTALLCLETADPTCPTDTLILFDIGTDSELSAMFEFAGALNALDLVLDVVVDAGIAGSASLSSATIRFQEQEVSAAPEPALGIPLCAALVALSLGRRRARRSK